MSNILSLENLVHLQNPWFANRGETPSERLFPKRDFYRQFKNLVEETKQISALIGIRRVGKTVILRQLLAEKLETPDSLPLFFSFDQEILPRLENPLAQIIDFYLAQILKKRLSQINRPVCLFFDEIQLVPFWQDTLKRYYDLNQNLKFIISGSSGLFLKKGSSESLAGRIFEQVLPPLTFREYQKVKKPLLSDKNSAFEDYLKYGSFFETIELTDEARKKEFLREWVLGKVLERDLPSLLRLTDTQILRLLFQVILGLTGQNVVLSKIAAELEISPMTATNYLAIFEKTLLLSSVFNLAGSFVRRERRLRKIYPATPNFLCLSAGERPNSGAMAESYAFNCLKQKFSQEVFFFQERGWETDFLLPGEKLALEVKYQEKIHPEDFKNLRRLMKRKKYDRGLLLTKSLTGEHRFPEGRVVSLPVRRLEEEKF